MSGSTRPCPSCKMPMPEIERVCQNCGHDLRVSGRRSYQRMNAVLSGIGAAVVVAYFSVTVALPRRRVGRDYVVMWSDVAEEGAGKYIAIGIAGLIVGGAVGALIGYYAKDHWKKLSEPFNRDSGWRRM